MNRDQYVRSNKVAFVVLMIIMGYLTVTLLMALLRGNSSPRVIVQIAISVVAIVFDVIVFHRDRDTRRGSVMMQAAVTLAFAVICFLNQTEETWLYTFPILLVSLAFLDVKNVIIQNSVLFVVNVIRLIIFYQPMPEYQQQMFIVIFVLIMAAIVSISITRLLVQYNMENVISVRDALMAQEDSGKRLIAAADDVAERFEKAMEMVGHLEESVNTAHFAMSNIADSTESTAEAVQSQAEMCARIQENTDSAEKQSVSMMEVSEQVTNTVAEGAEGINELREQAKNVENASNEAVHVIARLTERVEEVQGFIGSILSISNQTNLLSLNASIEAARAGAAGRGFAVVAEEVRQLSVQTKEASNSIQNIIQDLNEDTRLANESIENSVASVMRQNEMIATTSEKFERIDQKAMELAGDITDMEKVIKEILDAASIIADNLTQLSATSEEVAAASGEGLHNVEAAVEEMNKCKGVLEEIFQVTQGLKSQGT